MSHSTCSLVRSSFRLRSRWVNGGGDRGVADGIAFAGVDGAAVVVIAAVVVVGVGGGDNTAGDGAGDNDVSGVVLIASSATSKPLLCPF